MLCKMLSRTRCCQLARLPWPPGLGPRLWGEDSRAGIRCGIAGLSWHLPEGGEAAHSPRVSSVRRGGREGRLVSVLPAPHTVYALHAPGGTPPKVPLLGLPVSHRRQAEHVCREPRACHDLSAASGPPRPPPAPRSAAAGPAG